MNNLATPLHPTEALLLAALNADTIERLGRVQLMIFDVDGVLTDGRLWYNENGEVLKAFHVLDGHGLRMLQESGIHTAVITGRESPMVARRCAELGIAETHQGVRDKVAVLNEIAQRLALDNANIGYMGDDLIDLAVMQRVGFAASVANAPRYISQVAHWVATVPSGQGAARECCDLILASQNKLAAFFQGNPFLTTAGAIQ